jgi:hypothetical protein
MMKSIDLNIKSVEVKSNTREIRSEWTREMVYDLNSLGGITESLEKELLISIRKEMRKKSIKNIFSI